MSDPKIDVPREAGSLTLFASKVAVVAVITGLTFYLLTSFLLSELDSRMEDLVSGLSGREFWSKVDAELARQADPQRAMPPEKQRLLVARIRAISKNWKPLFKEIYAAIAEDAPEGESIAPSSEVRPISR